MQEPQPAPASQPSWLNRYKDQSPGGAKEFDYDPEYFGSLKGSWNEVSFPLIAPLARQAVAAGKPARILDYGCGSGTYARVLAEGGGEVDGCDVAEHSRETCERLYHRFIKIASASELPSAHYDLIFSTEVLEHIRDHQATLRDFHRMLRPGGTMVLTTTLYTPAVFTMLYVVKARRVGARRALAALGQWLLGFTSTARGDKFVEDWCFEPLGGHCHGFRRPELVRDFRAAGFDVQRDGVFYALPPLQFSFLHSHTLRGLVTRKEWSLAKRAVMVPVYCVGRPVNALLRRLGWFANNVFIVARKAQPRLAEGGPT